MEDKAANRHFLTIGHRGAAGEKFENSLSGFKHALSLDIDAIELDIRAHKGVLWVIHDHELSRLTAVKGLFDDLENPGETLLNNGEPIPMLKDILNLYWGKPATGMPLTRYAATTGARFTLDYHILF